MTADSHAAVRGGAHPWGRGAQAGATAAAPVPAHGGATVVPYYAQGRGDWHAARGVRQMLVFFFFNKTLVTLSPA